MKKFVNYFKENPRNIFLVDGVGALISTIWIILFSIFFPVTHEQTKLVIDVLTSIAIVFTIYSFTCYFFVIRKKKHFLKAILIANLIYALFTTITIILFQQHLLLSFTLYFIAEVMVLLALVYIEFNVWKSIS